MTKTRIMIVEDEKSLQEAMFDWYSKKDWDLEIEAPETSAEALKLLESGFYDVIITDEVMPGTRGSDLISSMLKMERYKKSHILLISGSLENELREDLQGLELNIQVISKPFRLMELDKILQPLLKK